MKINIKKLKKNEFFGKKVKKALDIHEKICYNDDTRVSPKKLFNIKKYKKGEKQ